MREIPLMQAFQHAATFALPHVRLFRREVLRAQIQGRQVKAGIRGQADLYALAHGGLHVELEVKALDGRLSPEQKAWRDWCVKGEIPWMLLKPEKGEEPDATVARWVSELRALVDSNGKA
jgi:hypothetical protein